MKIPQKLPQFEKLPVLFITTGSYTAKIYIAKNGFLTLVRNIEISPRQETFGKPIFMGKKSKKQNLSTFSNKGRCIENLKRKFTKAVHTAIHDILAEYGRKNIKEIYIFSPNYVLKKIEGVLDKEERKKIRMKFACETIKNNPLEMISTVWNENQKAIKIEKNKN